MGIFTVPSPVGGLNSRDSVAAMPSEDAIEMRNIVSRGLYVETRIGFANLGAPETFDRVHSLIPFYGTGSAKLLAGDDDAIKEISTGTASTLGTGFSGQPWQHTAFNSLVILTGGGTAQSYNGTTLTALVTTGAAPADLWGCNTYKGRVYYWKKNDDSFWYSPVGSYQGALVEFPMDTLLTRGGFLVAMVSMTMDSGAGADDLAAFVFSTGEVIVYQGDNPANASSWAMVGKYMIPRPCGIRGFVRIGASSVVMTANGYVNLNAVMAGATGKDMMISDKVRRTVNQLADDYGETDPASDQSCATFCSALNEVVFLHTKKITGAVTDIETDTNYTLLRINLDNGTWYTSDIQNSYLFGVHAICEFGGNLYGAFRQIDLGTLDFVQYTDKSNTTDSDGVKILFKAQQAFSQFPNSAAQITAAAFESNAVYANASDNLKGQSVVMNYDTPAYPTIALNGVTVGSSVRTPWKNVFKYGRAFAALWSERADSGVQWFRTLYRVKKAVDR